LANSLTKATIYSTLSFILMHLLYVIVCEDNTNLQNQQKVQAFFYSDNILSFLNNEIDSM